MRRVLLFCCLWLAPAVALAADAPPEVPGMVGSLVKMLAALALVVGVLLLFLFAQRRGFGLLPGVKEGGIRIVESRALGGRKFLCLVQVRGRELLLGVTNDRIELLERLGVAEVADQAAQRMESMP